MCNVSLRIVRNRIHRNCLRRAQPLMHRYIKSNRENIVHERVSLNAVNLVRTWIACTEILRKGGLCWLGHLWLEAVDGLYRPLYYMWIDLQPWLTWTPRWTHRCWWSTCSGSLVTWLTYTPRWTPRTLREYGLCDFSKSEDESEDESESEDDWLGWHGALRCVIIVPGHVITLCHIYAQKCSSPI